LERGSKKLASGLGRLSEASSRFTNQIEELQPEAGQLVDGLVRLDVGAGRLSSGLNDGYRRSGKLESGVERLRGGAAQIYSKTSAGRDRQRRLSPGIFDSGYLVLAALDGASAEERDQAEFAVNVESGGEAGAITVVPTTGPNEPETALLRERLSDSAEDLGEKTQTTTAVGGPAAQLAEYDEVTSSRLVLLILALALVTFLVLVPIFRSLVLPAIAVILNLVTVGAAFGVLALVFEGSSPLLGGPGFVDAVAISAIYTVIFGLTIDYEVFLITRMREGWIETGETNQAISYGLERTAGVVTGAAAIMIGVFVAFAFTEVANTRQFGVGLAVAVLLDATVVRLVLLPAMMRLAGDRCWWLPSWLDRRMPRLAVD
jgi:putative drug exporter of the RND superfamily